MVVRLLCCFHCRFGSTGYRNRWHENPWAFLRGQPLFVVCPNYHNAHGVKSWVRPGWTVGRQEREDRQSLLRCRRSRTLGPSYSVAQASYSSYFRSIWPTRCRADSCYCPVRTRTRRIQPARTCSAFLRIAANSGATSGRPLPAGIRLAATLSSLCGPKVAGNCAVTRPRQGRSSKASLLLKKTTISPDQLIRRSTICPNREPSSETGET